MATVGQNTHGTSVHETRIPGNSLCISLSLPWVRSPRQSRAIPVAADLDCLQRGVGGGADRVTVPASAGIVGDPCRLVGVSLAEIGQLASAKVLIAQMVEGGALTHREER